MLLVGNHHDYDDIAPDLFQLSEDVHALGTSAKLRDVLVPFENLQITGELSEGKIVAAVALYTFLVSLRISGAFGRVYKGFLQSLQRDGEQIRSLEVAIKTIKSKCSNFCQICHDYSMQHSM